MNNLTDDNCMDLFTIIISRRPETGQEVLELNRLLLLASLNLIIKCIVPFPDSSHGDILWRGGDWFLSLH